MKFKNGNYFLKINKIFLVKPIVFLVAPNTEKYEEEKNLLKHVKH
jgi:hypothetical protein